MSHRSFMGGVSVGLAAGLLFAVASVAVAGPQSGSGAGQHVAHVFTLVERATSDTYIDLGEPDDSVGDLIPFGNKLYNAANTDRVGRDEGFCIRTNVGVSYECSWTNILRDGRITVQGAFYDDGRDSWLSVTGGTGKYAHVTGQMKLHPRASVEIEYEFQFHIEY